MRVFSLAISTRLSSSNPTTEHYFTSALGACLRTSSHILRYVSPAILPEDDNTPFSLARPTYHGLDAMTRDLVIVTLTLPYCCAPTIVTDFFFRRNCSSTS